MFFSFSKILHRKPWKTFELCAEIRLVGQAVFPTKAVNFTGYENLNQMPLIAIDYSEFYDSGRGYYKRGCMLSLRRFSC